MAETTDLSKGLPSHPEKATLEGKNKFLGFWVFLAGETTMFATFFGTYLGLRNGTGSGPEAADIFSLPLVFIMTMILLTSSLTSVFAMFAMKKNQFKKMKIWMWVTVALGTAFLGFEIYEFVEYVHYGLGFTTSAFASSFYALVGLHGAHVLFGLCWISLLLIRYNKSGITLTNAPKFYVASLYWHFIDVVWIFIFTVVYLMGIGG
ncbi:MULTISPECIES: cytochrome (ubi)quinol oxidase subunit III [Geomicrobium]|uniref:Cytochrome c oxidase subunit 3 n=1 Tax=Geomicrobium sediminis TaxID=1347788 RepID=A0ABS2PJD4_9BACL|nr:MULTISPECIES: cytochrome (ubi)quinol oxidase subunit III [Geomicrobium]EZH67121.1 cytochrome B oxidoreductase [Bacillaceae bacterium JMAK1]MBM7635076.1 cytochrome c oxidase subunit 3 [Geomicrobium sediminis]GAJ99681.1 cytochrome c oxidase polypeptide III [Geomicrobium sp. JCM 19055]GAK07389.1 cytochrome c oxidase polypeptide III [Geomicrobium sp. JCM 19038]